MCVCVACVCAAPFVDDAEWLRWRAILIWMSEKIAPLMTDASVVKLVWCQFAACQWAKELGIYKPRSIVLGLAKQLE